MVERKIEYVEEKVETHEEVLDKHDRRIGRNENWRLQAQGALKILALIVGAGGLAVIGDFLLSLL